MGMSVSIVVGIRISVRASSGAAASTSASASIRRVEVWHVSFGSAFPGGLLRWCCAFMCVHEHQEPARLRGNQMRGRGVCKVVVAAVQLASSCSHLLSSDARMAQVLSAEWVTGKRLLDIGCNSGSCVCVCLVCTTVRKLCLKFCLVCTTVRKLCLRTCDSLRKDVVLVRTQSVTCFKTDRGKGEQTGGVDRNVSSELEVHTCTLVSEDALAKDSHGSWQGQSLSRWRKQCSRGTLWVLTSIPRSFRRPVSTSGHLLCASMRCLYV